MNPLTQAKRQPISIKDSVETVRKARGITPMPLEREQLLKRIRQGGQSADILGKAFLSMVQHSNFNASLGDIVYLDAEGFRLFHQIMHLKYIGRWSDTELTAIEHEIQTLIGLPY